MGAYPEHYSITLMKLESIFQLSQLLQFNASFLCEVEKLRGSGGRATQAYT
jgi:hypothetical protein